MHEAKTADIGYTNCTELSVCNYMIVLNYLVYFQLRLLAKTN